MAVITGADDKDDVLSSWVSSPGPNELLGLGGNDRLYAAFDGDILRGGDGNDTLVTGIGLRDVFIDGGAGDDSIFAEVSLIGQATIDGGDGDDTLLVGDSGYYRNSEISSIERIEFSSSGNVYLRGSQLKQLDATFVGAQGKGYAQLWLYADQGSSVLDASSIRFEGHGGIFQTLLIGQADHAERIVGSEFTDVFFGNGGGDRMIGGQGNDIYNVASANDVAIERANGGYDLVQASVDWRLGSHIEELWLGGSAIRATGNGLDNIILGNANANVINGGGGTDTLRGDKGDDTYVVDSSDDVVEEAKGGGTDTVRTTADYKLGIGQEIEVLRGLGEAGLDLRGNAFGNTILGTNGDDVLRGYGGRDVLKGGSGNDTLVGGSGVDSLDGGAGADTFLFNDAPNGDVDVVTVFDARVDRLALDDAAFAAFRNGATTTADFYDHLLFDATTGEVSYDANGDWIVFVRFDKVIGNVDTSNVVIV